VLALTISAFLCRGIALGTIPHNVHGDEGEMGLLARAILRGELRDPFTTAFLSHPSLWFFIQALALHLFGNTIAGLRMLSAVIGALTIPALYAFARPLYGRLAAILSATLLTFFHFHLHYSRIGLNNIADPLMMLLTLAAFFYSYRKRSAVGFALAGVWMGLAQYFYFGTRLILVIVFVLLVFLAIRERHQLLTFLEHIVLMGIGFLVAAGPLVRYYATHPEVYYGRMLERGLFQNGAIRVPDLQANGQSLFQALLGHAYRTFGLYVSVEELDPFYNSATPIMNHGMELLFLIGVVLVVLNWRKMENFVLLIWVVATAIFGGFLFSDGLQGQRYLIAAPALCILMALAMVQISALLSPILGLSQIQRRGVIALMVAAYTAWNLYFYFGIYTPLNSYAYNPTATEIATYLHNRAGQTFAYMFTPTNLYLNYATIKFIADDPPGMDVLDPLTSITALPEPPVGLRPVFIFIPERLNELAVVKQRYPNGNLREYARPQDPQHPYVYIYEPQ
jgi:4-amino-4-deoxy-L-arabinose transferase-like glycosyltransferase